MSAMKQFIHRSQFALWATVLVTATAFAEEPIADVESAESAEPTSVFKPSPEDDPFHPDYQEALSTAVALNYCRASFHRIRQSPTPAVMNEEQEKILNNLNLSQLDDTEVMELYSSVLDEISQMGINEQERNLYQKHHKSAIRRQVTWDAVAFGTDLLTAQFGNAVRSGANGWWDYRNKAFQRDIDLLKIDKTRMSSVMQRSNQFLDTFWKMARKKEIPDRWLVRGDDLDQLEVAMREEDAEVRLRVLGRMEPFMQAYPPFWYYKARTQQELGQLTEALDVYYRLERLGKGHFRKDDMLATATANVAAIEDYLGRDTAVASAQKSLYYSTEVWEANLVAARILQRHGQYADAEDAILRNLDVDLEQRRSTVFLASLYYFAREDEKLLALLNKPEAVAMLPAPVLLRCASLVGTERLSPVVVNNVLASLEAFPRTTIGRDELTLRVGHAWQLHLAKLEVYAGGEKLPAPQIFAGNGFHDLRYTLSGDWSQMDKTAANDLRLELTYPDKTTIELAMDRSSEGGFERLPVISFNSPPSLRISDVRVAGEQLVLNTREAAAPLGPIRVHVSRPNYEDLTTER
ncbi:MAG: tetratricopeptide repeat protein [Planctomycetaceae bacterium]|nr:tetratricopeptide repeat protein [Planctomycetaceae bacterium]